jgi:two-component system NtrC family sensor kinase
MAEKNPQKSPVQGEGFYRSLTRKMVITVILASVTPLILISGLIGYSFHTSYQNKVLAHLKELVQKHKQNIDSFLYERLAGIQIIARTFDFEQLSNESFLREKLSILREEYGGVFVDLGLVSQQGIQIAYAGPFELRKALYSEADWFKQAMQSPVFISDVFTGLRGMPHFIVTVKRSFGSREWILRATIDFLAFNSLVEATQLGTTGTAFIVNRLGDFQTRPRFEAAFHRTALKGFLAKRELEERVSVFQQSDSAGRDFIYVMTPLKNGEWILVYEQEEADAFSELYRARRLAMVIILLGGCGIAGTAIVLSRRMVRRVARADQEKEMMNEQVIEAGKLASVGELAAGIAHEINNPVAIMVEEAGWIEDLLQEEEFRGGENLQEFERAVKQIQTQGKRCKEITHKLLSFARKTDPKVKEVRLNDLAEEIVALSEQRARYSNVRINTAFMPDLPNIYASPSEMQQVLLNLINNAIDAMEKTGGSIEVSTRLEEGFVVLDVADTGPGIPQANLSRIFDPFFTTKPVGKGTGLGLSICYGIIHKMGGEISVNSAVGVGTVFHIRLPRPKEEKESGASPARGGGPVRPDR